MRFDSRSFLPLATALCVAGCSASDSAEPLAPAQTPTSLATSGAPVAAPGPATPAAMLPFEKTFWFDLDQSPEVVRAVEARCGRDAPGGEATATCIENVRSQAAREGIRFSARDPTGPTWTSFGIEDGGETIYAEVPFAIASREGPLVHVLARGPMRGTKVPESGFDRGQVAGLVFEVVDPNTIAMTDRAKGRLVFRAR